MNKLAVVGTPIAHSLSPVIFNHINQSNNIDSHYTRLCGSSFYDIIDLVKKLNITAFNITSPYKSLAYKVSENQHQNAQKLKLANFLYYKNEWRAYNTDSYAVSEIIKNNNIRNSSKVLILGSGAAAYTAYKKLKSMKFDNITVAKRNFLNSSDYIRIIELNRIKTFKNFDILINTLPENEYITAPMIDNPELTIIDAIYHKPYLKAAECKYISGLEWLAYQAIPFIELLYKTTVNFETVLSLLQDAKPKKSIVLIGFMAAGKSSIGQDLARKLKMNFIDTDKLIEKSEGKSIADIFYDHGENHFRELEKNMILNLKPENNSIIALGGGALNCAEIKTHLKQNYFVVYLYNDFETLKNRILEDLNSDRPLSNSENLKKLYDQRQDEYFNASDLVIYNRHFSETLNTLSNEIRRII